MTRLLLLVPIVLVLLLASSTLADEVTTLKTRLLDARTPETRDKVLDDLAARIGQDPGFTDAAAFGDWLGDLPRSAADKPRVRLRRAWAYVAAGRAAEARRVLEPLLSEAGASRGVALAYLGEVARQEGAFDRAFGLLTAAAGEGYRDPFLVESARKAAFQMRGATPSKAAEGLPPYVIAADGFLAVLPHPMLHASIARWLLDDYGAYAVPSKERAIAWARAAAAHAHAALEAGGGVDANARLAFDAAEALAYEDKRDGGRTLRFDLLAWAYRLGDRPADDSHEIPAVLTRLAELAVRDGEWELAHRLARRRLGISDSPAARRVLHALPPDIGD